MQLDRRERELLGDVAVPDLARRVQVLPLDPLGRQRGGGDGRPAPECLELGVDDLAVVVDLQERRDTF